jgi:hypothetical protein
MQDDPDDDDDHPEEQEENSQEEFINSDEFIYTDQSKSIGSVYVHKEIEKIKQ